MAIARQIIAIGGYEVEIVLIKPYEGEQVERQGKTVLVCFVNDCENLRSNSEHMVDMPWHIGIFAGVGKKRKETLKIQERYNSAARIDGEGIDCILAAPTNQTVLVQELSLCVNQGKGYWNTNVKTVGAE